MRTKTQNRITKRALCLVFAIALILSTTTITSAQTTTDSSSACDFTVSSHLTDGKIEGIKPGNVICIPKGKHNRLLFRNIVGTPRNPVIIRNTGGVAEIDSDASFGIKFEESKHFILSGDGTTDPFGIKVSTKAGFFVTMENFTTDFEITRIEIAGPRKNGRGEGSGFAGIGVKTSPYKACELFTDPSREAWIMRNVHIHHNYIHDTGGEGLYIGHGFYNGRKEAQCPKVTYSHSIRGVRMYANLIENVGLDGIQIKNADRDVKVYDNIIHNYGMRQEHTHNEGLFIGEGTVGAFYGNTIDTGSGNGAQIQALGNIDLYDNVFIGAGENGIYAVGSTSGDRIPDGYFTIRKNIVFGWKDSAFIFFNEDGGAKTFRDNIVVGRGQFTKKGATVDIIDNLISDDKDLIEGLASILNADRKNYNTR